MGKKTVGPSVVSERVRLAILQPAVRLGDPKMQARIVRGVNQGFHVLIRGIVEPLAVEMVLAEGEEMLNQHGPGPLVSGNDLERAHEQWQATRPVQSHPLRSDARQLLGQGQARLGILRHLLHEPLKRHLFRGSACSPLARRDEKTDDVPQGILGVPGVQLPDFPENAGGNRQTFQGLSVGFARPTPHVERLIMPAQKIVGPGLLRAGLDRLSDEVLTDRRLHGGLRRRQEFLRRLRALQTTGGQSMPGQGPQPKQASGQSF